MKQMRLLMFIVISSVIGYNYLFNLITASNNENDERILYNTTQLERPLSTPQTIANKDRNTHKEWINKELMEIALDKQAKYGMVIIQLLNAGYAEMTKSWLCNVNQVSTKVIPRLILIATDEIAKNKLENFKVNTGINYEIVLHEFHSNTNLNYGDYEYFRITLERIKLQNDLIKEGITIFTTESDTIWFKNGDLVIDEFDKLLQQYDMITINDCEPPQFGSVLLGFMALKGSTAMQNFFQRYCDEYTKHLLPMMGKEHIGPIGSAQVMLTEKLRKKQNMNINWTYASNKSYSNGQWYNDKQRRTNHILVVQNNWIVGNGMKTQRAKDWNHWFSNGKVCLNDVHPAFFDPPAGVDPKKHNPVIP